MGVLLPQTAINVLPFSAEPLASWKGKIDIRMFIDALYANIFPPFSAYLYKREKKSAQDWSRKFAAGAQEPLRNKELKSDIQAYMAAQAVHIPSFSENTYFGRAAKYVMAWNSCVQTVLEDSGFYSLAHILESEGEISSSLLLASHLYYKQAVQILRNFLEELIMPIHFCDNMHEFEQWKANHYRTPALRGRDGLIRRLADKGILPAAIATEVTNLYGDLNGYVHGSENKLNYKNVHSSRPAGLMFRYDDFCTWADYLSRSIDIGIRLLRINYLQWDTILSAKREALKREGRVICTSCHNETDFDKTVVTKENISAKVLLGDGTWAKGESFAGYTKYTCLKCGTTMMILQESK